VAITRDKKIYAVGAGGLALLVLAAGAYLYFSRNKSPGFDFVIAKRRDVVREVSVTGHVVPAESVELGFEQSGKISRIYVGVGDRVYAGQLLLEQDNTDLMAELAEAQANVRAERAKLRELRQGSRPEEVRVKEVKVSNTQIALEEARKHLVDTIRDAYTKSDDAIRNRVDQFFDNPRSANPELSFTVPNPDLERNIEEQRYLLEQSLVAWRNSIKDMTIENDLTSLTADAQKYLMDIQSFLADVALALSSAEISINLTQATLDGYKSDVATARANVNTAISNLSSADKSVKTETSNLALAESELALVRAGSVTEQIVAQEAKVEQAAAAVETIRARLAKTALRAPISGIVTIQDADVGEIVAANTPVATLISEANFEIETNVPEVDIASVVLGARARVTLDAYGSDTVFEAVVTRIDPAETIVDGVTTYKVTLQFTRADERIKSGMTADIDIIGEQRSDVLAVPGRAVFTENGEKFVRVVEGEEIREVPVVVGLRGSDGSMEITDGIKEGDKVIVFMEP
jgi:HlyD family secretion protein